MSVRQRFALLAFFVALALLNYPVVNVVNVPELWAGIPQVVLYVLALWLLLIAIAYIVSLEKE